MAYLTVAIASPIFTMFSSGVVLKFSPMIVISVFSVPELGLMELTTGECIIEVMVGAQKTENLRFTYVDYTPVVSSISHLLRM